MEFYYYFFQKNLANANAFRAIQLQLQGVGFEYANNVTEQSIKLQSTEIDNQFGEKEFLTLPYFIFVANVVAFAGIHAELLALEGVRFFDNQQDAYNFIQNGLI